LVAEFAFCSIDPFLCQFFVDAAGVLLGGFVEDIGSEAIEDAGDSGRFSAEEFCGSGCEGMEGFGGGDVFDLVIFGADAVEVVEQHEFGGVEVQAEEFLAEVKESTLAEENFFGESGGVASEDEGGAAFEESLSVEEEVFDAGGVLFVEDALT
jgi:hypothetical protein